jgi:hypothetical protein
VRRAIVDGQLTGPKSRHGRRSIPISTALAAHLRPIAASRAGTDLLFVGAQGATLWPSNLRYRVMIPAAERAGVPWARFGKRPAGPSAAAAHEERRATLTVAVKEYFADVRRVRGTNSMSCSTDRGMTDEIGAAVRS